jgi:ataxia telangiectasia mutated family protein
MGNFRDVLRVIVGNKPNTDGETHHAMDIDDKDGFAPIRTSHNIAQSTETGQQANSAHASRFVIGIGMAFLATVPILQSSSGEPTRDKDMTELVLSSSGDAFLLLGPIYFEKVRQGILSISLNVLDNFLDKFGSMLTQYGYSRSEKLQLLTTQFLDSTLKYWLKDAVSNSEVGERIRALCRWLSQALRGQKIRSWRSRDCVVRFLTRYIAEDAAQAVWSIPPADEKDLDEEPETLPVAMLPRLGADEDIRIRFRVAGANASLFSAARKTGRDPSQLYLEIKEWLTKDILECAFFVTTAFLVH